jgi:hypothetical protein
MRRKKLDPLIHMCGAGPRGKCSTVRGRTVVTLVTNRTLTDAKSASTTMLATMTSSRAGHGAHSAVSLDRVRPVGSGATVVPGQPVVAGVVVPG